MGFFDEFLNLFNEDEIDKSFKMECYGGKALVLSGHKKILKLTESEMSFGLKNNKSITLQGAKLIIKKLEEGEVWITGTILSVNFSSGAEEK